eukprot:GHVS01046613.1.p1 GENE.GHVS01046613.1~~GHVS01046613.1.p1  ORF type:complete len:122 (-),score=37.34 GHVS01046613.1:123-488(-)
MAGRYSCPLQTLGVRLLRGLLTQTTGGANTGGTTCASAHTTGGGNICASGQEEVTRRLEMAERQRAEFGREVRAASSGTVWQETGGEGVAGGEEGEEGDAVFGYYEEMQQTMTTEFEEFAE